MSYEQDLKNEEERQVKADQQDAQVTIEIEDLLSNCSEIDAIITKHASDIANVYILNQGKATCADLVLHQIDECILLEAESNVEARNH